MCIFGHRVGDAEAMGDGHQFAHPGGTGRRITLVIHRVDRSEQLGPVVHGQARIGIRETGTHRLECERQPAHLQFHAPHRAGWTDMALESQDVAQRDETGHRRVLPPLDPGDQVRRPRRLDGGARGRPAPALERLVDQSRELRQLTHGRKFPRL